MSLQVWLPLNGNLNNHGLSDITFSDNYSPTYTDGKIGKCMNGYTEVHFTSSATITTSGLSISMWVKSKEVPSTSTVWWLIAGLEYTDGTTHKIYTADCGSGRYKMEYNPSCNIYCNTQIWHHIVYTLEGNVLTGYLDGNKIGTSIETNDIRTVQKIYIGGNSNVWMNDFRIYDHCLSAKEVKEISQGLVCHYKLSGAGGENLITNIKTGGRTTLIDNYGIYADFSQNLDTFAWIKVSPALELDKTYTLSFDVNNFPDNGVWQWQLWNNANYLFNVKKNGHYSYTFTPDASLLPSNYSLTEFLFDDGGRTNPANVVQFTNFKIEEGSRATPWCPNPSDALYSTLGFNDGIEYDCSGYGNNGTKVGDIAWSGDTARYNGSYKFNGDTNAIKTNFYDYTLDGIFTINMWFRKNTGEWSSKPYETLLGGPSGFEIESKDVSTNAPVIYTYSWGQGKFTYELDKWNMLTVVRTTSDTKWYLNGELKLTGTSGTIPSGEYFIGAWRTSSEQNYKGNISDFRVYATALSADDIKELYNVSASINKTGVLSAYEFIEEG